MQKVAEFQKVSIQRFEESMVECARGCTPAVEKTIRERCPEVYSCVKMPKRATKGSAGYDFYMPYDVVLGPGESARIPTGIRARIAEGWVLMLYPRSGLGFKFRLQLDNSVGVIDSDYYFSDNEGHIMAQITNDTHAKKTVELKAGQAFMQGIFTPFGITVDDEADGVRNGGFGSTTK